MIQPEGKALNAAPVKHIEYRVALQHPQHPVSRIQGEGVPLAQRQQTGYMVDVGIGQQH
ncbi:hypothetical protein D3C86_2229740 [compost metagenome]